jgi:hypothetical protein
MNKRGTIALEALIASAQILLLAAAVASLLGTFWQSWHGSNEASRQRQWSVVAFAYLDADLENANSVVLTASEIRVSQAKGVIVYRVTADKSFYRGLGDSFYPLAIVDSVRWWRDGQLLWVELFFPEQTYRCCYCLPENSNE